MINERTPTSTYFTKNIPMYANIISYHVVFKVKTDDDCGLELKGRVVFQVNRGAEKNLVRSY